MFAQDRHRVSPDNWRAIFNAVESDDSLSEHNVMHKIKEEIEKRDRHAYEEWQRNDFDIDYKFDISIATGNFGSVVGLLSMAMTNRNPKVLRILLDKGANIHTILPLFVRIVRE